MNLLQIQEPWVTFCMSTYKRPEFLRKQLNAILNQTFTNFQIIISDNDTEASGEVVVKKINDSRILYECNGENLGMVKSFNKSLYKATSEYVVMITDDDPVYPEMLQTLYDLTLSHPGYGMYFGGNDKVYSTVQAAKVANSKVGRNSQLANLNLGQVRIFSSHDFPLSFLQEDFGGGILWSAGIVKRKIAFEIGGMPDYGTPNMADCAYVILAGSYEGAVFINTALSYQFIHAANYSFGSANYADFSNGATFFYKWVKERIPKDIYDPLLDKKLKDFVARVLVSFFIFAKKNIANNPATKDSFKKCVRNTFQIPFMRKWKIKYWIAIYLPFLFPFLVWIKVKIFK